MTSLRLPVALAASLLAASASATTYTGADLASQGTILAQQPYQIVGTSLFFPGAPIYTRPTILSVPLPLPAGTQQVKLRLQVTRHDCLWSCAGGALDEDFFMGLSNGVDTVTAELGDNNSPTLGALVGAELMDTGTDNLILAVGTGVNVVRPPVGGSQIVEMNYTLSGSGTQLDMAVGSAATSFSSAKVLPPASLRFVVVRDNDPGEQYQIDWLEVKGIGGEKPVAVDIKPGSCPNPLNADKANGVISVAVSGNADVAVADIDPASVRLAGIAPLRWSVEDVATTYAPFTGKQHRLDCVAAGGDGLPDLVLKFEKNAVAAALGGNALVDGATVVVPLTGSLQDGNAFAGEDVMWVRK